MEERRFEMKNGDLTCQFNGDRAELRMEVHPAAQGLYRGYLLGKSGSLDLGLLLPEGGCLRLNRSFPIEMLARQGCWPVTGARAVLTHAFDQGARRSTPQGWAPLRNGASLFPHDLILAQAAGELPNGLLYRRQDGHFAIAAPWDPKAPFPLLPVFCFAQARQMAGRMYVVCSFHGDGTPVIPPLPERQN